MSKLTVCKTCGAQIAKSARACPHCGARRSQVRPLFTVMLVLVILFIVVGTISSKGRQLTKVGTSSGGNSSSSTPASPVYTVGDTLELQNVQVTLKAVRESSGEEFYTPGDGKAFLVFEFDIANNSSEELGISSMLSFSAYADDYALEYSISAILYDGGKQLDGSIAAGKKMSGIVGYEVPENWKQAEVRVKPNVWKDHEFVFSIDRAKLQ